jgi:hypothetical protein
MTSPLWRAHGCDIGYGLSYEELQTHEPWLLGVSTSHWARCCSSSPVFWPSRIDPARGEVKAPWLSWGPYLWPNGTNKRSDGFFFEKSDIRDDEQMHHSKAGQVKLGRELVGFFKEDTTTRDWFRAK